MGDKSLEAILFIAWIGCFLGGIAGLIRPAWIKLSTRWQAGALCLSSTIPITAAGEFYPAKDVPPQNGATFGWLLAVAFICGFTMFLRIAFRAALLTNGAADNEAQGVVGKFARKWAAAVARYRAHKGAKPDRTDPIVKDRTAAEKEERRKAGEDFLKKLGERRQVAPVRSSPVDLVKLDVAIRDVRVIPKTPSKRKGRVEHTPIEPVNATIRDHSSGWAGHISYVDAKGESSERLIVVKRIEGYGRTETVFAYCCERKASRRFLVKGIKELWCAETGEVLNPRKHFDQLARDGAIGTTDKSLADLITILVFLARCDGEFHPLEMDSIEEAIDQHMICFGGDRKSSRKAALNARKLAPDNIDFMNAINRLGAHPQSALLAGIILEAADDVVEADGKLTAAEEMWQEMVFAALEDMALAKAA